ncbi:MAG: NosD domain-containing protein [Methanomicrobiales archaeon]
MEHPNEPPVIIAPDETPAPDVPLETSEPTPVPTIEEVAVESTVVPISEPTIELTVEPTVIPTTSEVTVEPTAIPTTEPTAVETIVVTTEPTVIPTTVEVTIEPTVVPTTQLMPEGTIKPTAIPTIIEVTADPTTVPQVTILPTSPPVTDTAVLNETIELPPPVVTPIEQPLATPHENLTPTVAPENNVALITSDSLLGNTTSELVDTLTPILESNTSVITPDATGQTENNYTWSDPPLNTSADNPYYTGTGWVINVPGHDWTMDMNSSNNTGSGVTLSENVFSGFGSDFAILINTGNVIFDGMGAILNGKNATRYGIIVQNSPASDLYTSNGPLGGISITNITLTGFQEAGIFFNNVIGNLPGDIASNITDVHADSNNVTASSIFGDHNTGSGIVLQDSYYVAVSNSTANDNGQRGIWLSFSSDNNITGSSASGNIIGITIEGSNNTLSGNTASGNTGGFNLWGSNNTISGNTASENKHEGFTLGGSTPNTIFGNTFFGNTASRNFVGFAIDGTNNTVSGNTASGNDQGFNLWGSNNTISGNTASGNNDGFVLWGSILNTLSGNTASGNDWSGFFLYNSTSNLFSDNTASGNYVGFNLQGNSSSNNIMGNKAIGNNQGIDLYSSSFNTLSSNNASGNDWLGFLLYNSTSNTLSDNTVSGNNEGFYLYNSSYNTLSNNNASGNDFIGFDLGFIFDNTNSSCNTLSGNSASGNDFVGFSIGGNNNILSGNTASDNSEGFHLWSSNHTLSGNTASGNNGGFYTDGSNNTVSSNIASGNGEGFGLYGDNNTVSGNIALGNGVGLELWGSNSTISRNTALRNEFAGLMLGGSNNTISENIASGSGFGFYLHNSISNNFSHNTVSGNSGGVYLSNSISNNFSGNIVSGNSYDGFYLSNSSSNTLSSNIITGNLRGLRLLYNSSGNTIYNNYLNNADNLFVDDSSIGNSWNISKTPGINIVGGSFIGGNVWATPSGNGFSQTHPDRGDGFTTTGYSIDANNTDYLPLWVAPPTPPTPHPNLPQSDTYDVILPSFPAIPLPYDSGITANDFPQNMEPGHTYSVGLTVTNTGTMDWSSKSGIELVSSSPDGFTFNPAKSPIPEGVVIHPGESYTFPVDISVPSTMKGGSHPLLFSLANIIQTKTKPVIIRFGETLKQNVIVGNPVAMIASSVMKGVVKMPTSSPTVVGISTGYIPRPLLIPTPVFVVNRTPITRLTETSITHTFISKTSVSNHSLVM